MGQGTLDLGHLTSLPPSFPASPPSLCSCLPSLPPFSFSLPHSFLAFPPSTTLGGTEKPFSSALRPTSSVFIIFLPSLHVEVVEVPFPVWASVSSPVNCPDLGLCLRSECLHPHPAPPLPCGLYKSPSLSDCKVRDLTRTFWKSLPPDSLECRLS